LRPCAVLAALAAAARVASAQTPEPAGQPEAAPGQPEPTTAASQRREMTAADVAGAPVAGDESGRTDPVDDDSVARQGLRGALFVPKVAVNLALSPARLSAWAYDRYHLDELYYRVFFNDARTIGVIPSASFTSGFGINAGARFVDRDLFGAREQLTIAAGIGGRYQQVYKVAVQSGDRLGRVAVELDGQYELRPKDP